MITKKNKDDTDHLVTPGEYLKSKDLILPSMVNQSLIGKYVEERCVWYKSRKKETIKYIVANVINNSVFLKNLKTDKVWENQHVEFLSIFFTPKRRK